MKNKFTLFFSVLITMVSFAQHGINYKAIVKDDTGNVISEQLIVVQFSIYQGDTTNVANIIYQEQFTPTTNTNGLITVNIGESTTVLSGDFSTIDWSTNNHSLKTEINIGAGLVNMGITEFKVVPYAKHAQIAEKIVKLPEPYILGRSAQSYNGRFQFNGKYGWQAAQEMCESSYPNNPNVRAFTLEQIAQAIVLGNWDTNDLISINQVTFWAITPITYNTSSNSFPTPHQNNLYGLNLRGTGTSVGTTARITIKATNIPSETNADNPSNTYLEVNNGVASGNVYPCMCGTYK